MLSGLVNFPTNQLRHSPGLSVAIGAGWEGLAAERVVRGLLVSNLLISHLSEPKEQ